MDKIVKYFLVFLFAAMLVCNIACTKEEEEETSMYGTVKGIVTSSIGGNQGFKVSLLESDNNKPIQVIVTEEDGSFSFNNVAVGNYTIAVQKEGFYCIQVIVNNTIVNSNYYDEYEIQVEGNQTIEIDIRMHPNSSYINDVFKVTDANGNAIGNYITIQKYTPIIAMRIYNETSQDISWYISRWNLCSLEGARDTVVGDYHGFTGFGTYQIFSDFSPSSGTISPGENVLITGTINQEIYALHYFSREYNSLSISANSSTHSYSKDITLVLPFVNITDMSEWHDKK